MTGVKLAEHLQQVLKNLLRQHQQAATTDFLKPE